jgi:hypothetical protein
MSVYDQCCFAQQQQLAQQRPPAAFQQQRLAQLARAIVETIQRVARTTACAHPTLLRAAFEAPVVALVGGLVAECPECAVPAAALGQRLVDAGVAEVLQSCPRQ